MAKTASSAPSDQTAIHQASAFAMETLVGMILLVGVITSMVLILLGVIWHYAINGNLNLDFTITGQNFFGFILGIVQGIFSGTYRPRLLVRLGIAVLLLTPYIRVLASVGYFAFVEQNIKYSLFTLFVFSVLTYSLFLR